MTTAGWVLMIVSVTFVYGLAGWCYRKMLRAPEQDRGGTGEPDVAQRPASALGLDRSR